jgi:hypothetical protein
MCCPSVVAGVREGSGGAWRRGVAAGVANASGAVPDPDDTNTNVWGTASPLIQVPPPPQTRPASGPASAEIPTATSAGAPAVAATAATGPLAFAA